MGVLLVPRSIERESLAAAYVIDSLYARGNGSSPLEVCRSQFGPIESVSYLRSLPGVSDVGVFFGREIGLLFISAGISQRSDGQNVALGYRDRRLMERENQANDTLFQAASQVLRGFPREWMSRSPRIRMFGHSSGGAMLEVLAKMMELQGIFPDSIVTYGSPKPGFAGATVERPDRVERVRWMNAGDPVPFVPNAALSTGLSIALLFTGADPAPWACVHGSGGRSLTAGAWAPAPDAVVYGLPEARLDEWVNGDPDKVYAHSIVAYISNLRALVAPALTPGPRVDVQPVKPPSRPVTSPERQPVPAPLPPPGLGVVPVVSISDGMVTYRDGSRIPSVINRSHGMAQSKVGPKMRMKVKDNLLQFVVTWMGATVARSDKFTKAKTLAKAGNKLLRVMGNDVVISQAAFITAFNEWITKASAAGNGVNPPIVSE